MFLRISLAFLIVFSTASIAPAAGVNAGKNGHGHNKAIPAPARSGIDHIVVVTPDPVVSRAADRFGDVEHDPGTGLLGAVDAGVRRAVADGHTGRLGVLLADLPALRAHDLAAALNECARHEAAFVPDLEGTGTVLLAATAFTRLRPAFGPGSASRHAAGGAVRLDLDLIRAMRRITDQAKEDLDKRIAAATDGAVTACTQVARIVAWLAEQGADIPSLAKAALGEALDDHDLPEHVRAVLELRQSAAKSSTAKLDAMLACVSADGRARGQHLYHGASTGRWSGRLIQVQNFPRGTGTVDDPEAAVPDFFMDFPDA